MTPRDRAAQLHSQALSSQQPGTSVESLPVLTMIVRVLLPTRCCTVLGVPFRRLNAGQSEQQLCDYTGKLPKSNEFRKLEVRMSNDKIFRFPTRPPRTIRQRMWISWPCPPNPNISSYNEFASTPAAARHTSDNYTMSQLTLLVANKSDSIRWWLTRCPPKMSRASKTIQLYLNALGTVHFCD
jgi:hypothetical protein